MKILRKRDYLTKITRFGYPASDNYPLRPEIDTELGKRPGMELELRGKGGEYRAWFNRGIQVYTQNWHPLSYTI
jgi:hypothetical protein